ncbi:hypothetical protein, partial [Nonomuraea rubra]|uniref:hypothetical protein n=1 Tax=Nonomuraea rubra TaxID=46180 RepID=UPI0031E6017C
FSSIFFSSISFLAPSGLLFFFFFFFFFNLVFIFFSLSLSSFLVVFFLFLGDHRRPDVWAVTAAVACASVECACAGPVRTRLL